MWCFERIEKVEQLSVLGEILCESFSGSWHSASDACSGTVLGRVTPGACPPSVNIRTLHNQRLVSQPTNPLPSVAKHCDDTTGLNERENPITVTMALNRKYAALPDLVSSQLFMPAFVTCPNRRLGLRARHLRDSRAYGRHINGACTCHFAWTHHMSH